MPDFAIDPVEAQIGQGAQQNSLLNNPIGTLQGINQLRLFPTIQANLQTELATRQQALASQKISTLQGLLAQTTDDSEVPGVYNMAINAGLIDPETAANAMGGNIADLSPSAIHAARERAITGTGNAAELAADRGVTSVLQTGAGQKTINTKVGPGGVTNVTEAGGPAAFVPNALGPTDLATRVEVTDPDSGAKTMDVLGNYINPDGSWKAGTPHPLTALGPLSANAQATLGASYGPQIAAFENSQPATANARQAVENARQEAADFTTGPLSDQFQKWGEFLSEFGIPSPKFAGMSETAAREAFRQSLIQVLRGQQAALHMDQTDAARQTAGLDVPGSITTPGGMKIALGTIEGNYDAQLAMGKAWQQQKARGGPASWGSFQTEFPQKVPPSIFQAQYNPDQIAEQQKGWSAAQKADWQRRYDTAKKLGWLPADAQ